MSYETPKRITIRQNLQIIKDTKELWGSEFEFCSTINIHDFCQGYQSGAYALHKNPDAIGTMKTGEKPTSFNMGFTKGVKDSEAMNFRSAPWEEPAAYNEYLAYCRERWPDLYPVEDSSEYEVTLV